jgi:ribosome-associated toxin RatA of RatAB toxin-antitoxin module
MASVNKSVVVPYTVAQMFDLVNNLEDYPKFLPWCKDISIHAQDLHQVQATIHIAKGLWRIKSLRTILCNQTS